MKTVLNGKNGNYGGPAEQVSPNQGRCSVRRYFESLRGSVQSSV